MPEIDNTIALQAQPIDLGKTLATAMQLRQMRQQMQVQNSLRAIFAQPGATDPKNMPNTLAMVMKISPEMGLKMMDTYAQSQQREATAQRDAAKEDNEFLQTTIGEAVGVYDGALGGATSDDIAQQQARQFFKDRIDALPKDDAWKAKAYQQFAGMNPKQWRLMTLAPQVRTAQAEEAGKVHATYEAPNGEEYTQMGDGSWRNAQGQPVPAPPRGLRSMEPGFNPQAAAARGWQVLTDPSNNTQYRYNPDTGQATTLQGKPYTPGGAEKIGGGGGGNFTSQDGELLAALAEQGVSLPAGFRSKQQQLALLHGLFERNPGASADEIAEGIKKGQIEFGAQKKETQTAAGVAGKVEVAANEITGMIPLVKDAAAKVPRGTFVPINRLLQMPESALGDPNLRALKIRINSILNAYDMLSARGGTDQEKRREVRSLITSADSPAALDAALQSFALEADVAHKAAVQATRVPELDTGGGGGTALTPKLREQMGQIHDAGRRAIAIKRLKAAGYDTSGL